MTAASEVPPQGLPRLEKTHAPSKLPPPPPAPPLFRDARRGSSASGLLCRAGFAGSTVRGASREPDSDFSSLPMLPPVLPDCANAAPRPIATMDDMQRRTNLIGLRMGCRIITWLPMDLAEI
jgi:hypothetical protein